jgi:hypothetical protein
VGGGEEAFFGKCLDEFAGGAVFRELRERGAEADGFIGLAARSGIIAEGDEGLEDFGKGGLGFGGEAGECGFGLAAEGTLDAAESFVGGVGELMAVFVVLEEFEQDEFEEGEELGAVGGIAEDAAGEFLAVFFLVGESGEAGGFLDEAGDGIRLRRENIEQAAAFFHADEGRLALDFLIEVAADGGDDPEAAAAGEGLKEGEEGGAGFAGEGVFGEEFFELIDDEEETDGATEAGLGGLEGFGEGVVVVAGGVFGEVRGEFFEGDDLVEELGEEGFFGEEAEQAVDGIGTEVGGGGDEGFPDFGMFVGLVGEDFGEDAGAGEGGLSTAAGTGEEEEGAAVGGFFFEGIAGFEDFLFATEEDIGVLGLEGMEAEEGRALFFDVPDDFVHIAGEFIEGGLEVGA